jgi:GT2 family glycosyltransferase
MDERYFVYCDDIDFCYRARQASLTLYYEPGITLLHKAGSLTGEEPEFARRFITRNTVYFIRKSYGRPESLARLLFLQAYFLGRLLLRQDGWQEFSKRQRWFRDGFVLPLPRPAVNPAAAQTTD